MISYIKGKMEFISENYIVLDNNGIGYQIYVSPALLGQIPQTGEVKIYTYMNVKEDGIELYGFLSPDEIGIFNRLITVSGIGPKGAQSVLNVLNPAEIALAIVTDDAVTLSRAPGIGKKTAQRIILELKDKIKTNEAVNIKDMKTNGQSGSDIQEAAEALIALGFSRGEAVKAVMLVTDGKELSLEEIIKLSLKKLY